MEPIHRAAIEGDVAAITRLVKADARCLDAILDAYVEVERFDMGGLTPLMMAAFRGHDAAVRTLLALGADLEAHNEYFETAMGWACIGNRPGTLGVLLDAGASLRADARSWTLLTTAIAFTTATDCVALLLARGGEAELELERLDTAGEGNEDNGEGWTALFYAVRDWDTDSRPLVLLLQAGADPTVRDKQGQTPVDLARELDFPPCAALLEAATAEPQRPTLLLKSRALLDAAAAIEATYRTDEARNKEEGAPAAGQWAKAATAAAPVYLKGRVGQGQAPPRVEVVGEEEEGGDERLRACIKYALGLEGGGGVVFEGREPAEGMVKEIFVELCELLVPKWARAGM